MTSPDVTYETTSDDREDLIRYSAGQLNEILQRLWAVKATKEPYCAISADECITVAYQASDVFAAQETLIEVKVPVSICGDTHGSYGKYQNS